MQIISSAELPIENQQKLIRSFPKDTFTFCKDMNEAKEYLPEIEILITYGTDLSNEVLDKAKNLKWIMVIAAGIDALPFEELNKRNILVTSAKGIHKAPMSEYVIFMLLSVYRQSKTLIENERNKIWTRDIHMEEITGKQMMVAGTGLLGCEIARVAKAFNMKTIGVSRSGNPVEYFDEIITRDEMEKRISEVDFVVSILPSTPDTKGFFEYKHFEAMSTHGVFMNIGRGDAVKGEDVLKAIREQEIQHAVLDVFEKEPLDTNDPFWEEENITVTTHLSGVSPHYFTRALDIFSDNFKAYKTAGKDLVNIVDTLKGY